MKNRQNRIQPEDNVSENLPSGQKVIPGQSAAAKGEISMEAESLNSFWEDSDRKESVLNTARNAGVLSAKRAGELIPIPFTYSLSRISIKITRLDSPPGMRIEAEVQGETRAGLEAAALSAVSGAGITLLHLLGGADQGMKIREIRLAKWSKYQSAGISQT